MIGRIRCSLINVSAPATSHVMEFDVSALRWSGDLRNMLNELREAMRERDEEYAIRYIHGSKMDISIRHERVNHDTNVREEVRYLKVAMCPSRVNTLLSVARDKVYTALNTYCITQKIIVGNKRKCVYFLPFSSTNDMLSAIADANKMVREAQKILNEYVKSKHFDRINSILVKYKLLDEPLKTLQPIPEITYSLTPIVFDPDVLREYIEPKLMADVERQIVGRKKAIVQEAIKLVQVRINQIVDSILKQKVNEMDVQQAINRLKALVDDVGLSNIPVLARELDSLHDTFVQAIQNGYVFDTKEVGNRVTSLLKEVASMAGVTTPALKAGDISRGRA